MTERTQADYKALAEDFFRIDKIVDDWGAGGRLAADTMLKRSFNALGSAEMASGAVKTPEGRAVLGRFRNYFETAVGALEKGQAQMLILPRDLPDSGMVITDKLDADEHIIVPYTLEKLKNHLFLLAAQGEEGVETFPPMLKDAIDNILDGFKAQYEAQPVAAIAPMALKP